MRDTALFVLATLAERGPMHGHQLRLQAAEDHAQEWAQVSPGAIYGSLTRLAAQGLVSPIRTEQEGSRPARQIYDISDDGRRALSTMLDSALSSVTEHSDPFDLALAHSQQWDDEQLRDLVTARIAVIEGRLAQLGAHQQSVSTWLSAREALVLEHQRARLLAEVDWHRHLLSTLGSPEAAALGSAADRGPQR